MVNEGGLTFEDPKWLVFLWPREWVWISLGTQRGILGTKGGHLSTVPVNIRLCSFLSLEGLGRAPIIMQISECGCS